MDYYELMGIARNANQDEIVVAYRQLARQYHPDMRPENAEVAIQKFKEINVAFEVLSNSERRRAYDLGHPAPKPPKPKPKKDETPKDPNLGRWWSPPPPKFDLWGNPIEPEKSTFKDVFAHSYEAEGQPDIR